MTLQTVSSMTDRSTARGSRVDGVGPAPARLELGRVCVVPRCSTRLNTYDWCDTCFRHSPIRFLWVRCVVRGGDASDRTALVRSVVAR